MTKLSIVVKNEKETKTVKVEGLSEQAICNVIRETFGLGFTLPPMMTHPNTDPIILPLKAREGTASIVVKPSTTIISNNDKEPGVSALEVAERHRQRNKQLPLLGSENRSSFSLEDSARTSMQNTKMTEGGVRLFRTYSKCPHCETEHTGRYVNAEQEYVKCFECKEKIAVLPATEENQIFEGKEIPKMSIDGYYFSAKNEYFEPAPDLV
jgi:hypothetical protein